VKAADRAIVSLSNFTVRARHKRTTSEHLLLILPHCLQNSKCQQRLDAELCNCRRCGKCQVKELIELAEGHKVRVVMASGGELALQHAKDRSVHAVVAVACEKELRQGILAAFPKAVLGIINERPHGPCKDTRVNVEAVRKAVKWFLETDLRRQRK
jgi:hypothetical protein